MTCHSDSILSVLSALATIRRPRLLLRTARHGTADYRRETDLKRVLRLPATPAPGAATLHRLIDLEAQHDAMRTRPLDEVGNPWRAARHVEILIALIAEASLLAEAVTPLPRD
ncbi:MAG: hypothetical protein H6900_07400 [Rhodobacter sp.]|uniref:DUF6477 family protein n=1 Tax=Pararhodobacter sp. TaxID=2127056 RepID=UPI001DCBAAED|nr:DUF6477 family protein [Pararhodobacter sp.]MCB1344664.1 hypothetical protein [Paracoccaceae bacterium]MCB1408112.1 hypothetical protein [Paracoccaceae bacterium]MCC0073100.1 hypothetical protein [Rhodobacter sp.]HPD92896.1 DUF6477 family protein [Pararhodobacter sp.]